MGGLRTVFTPGAPGPHLQQGPFIALGALVALLLLSIHGVVDSGEVVTEHGQHGSAHPWKATATSETLSQRMRHRLRLRSWK